jgi:hypothetical protein
MSVSFFGLDSPVITVPSIYFDDSQPEDFFNQRTERVAVWGDINLSQTYAELLLRRLDLNPNPEGAGTVGSIKGQQLIDAHNKLQALIQTVEGEDTVEYGNLTFCGRTQEQMQNTYYEVLRIMRLCIAYDSEFRWA